jgi:serine/threonine protein phosphatase 1
MNRYCIGDIHGRVDALKEVLTKAKFDYDNDMLIVLGDVVDGGEQSKQVIDELLKIKNIIYIIGNHDAWYIKYLKSGRTNDAWITQGGASTLNSYGAKITVDPYNEPIMLGLDNIDIPQSHKTFFEQGLYYFEFENMLFVHGGYDTNRPIQEQDPESLMWDRDLIRNAENINIPIYDKVFIGHTTTQMIEREIVNYHCRECQHEWEEKVANKKDMIALVPCPNCESENIRQSLGCTKPIKMGKLYCLDTGAGWDGKLSIMDIDSDKFWQSELQIPAIR